MRVSEMPLGARGDVAVTIFRRDMKTLASLAGQIQ
jgi:Cu/Ag efflux pump CusA